MKVKLILINILLLSGQLFSQTISRGQGEVYFISDAPLETIEATSKDLIGIIDLSKMNFAFKVNMTSFDGFNSALQKEHFNEHYIESSIYPNATFAGRLLMDEVCEKDCKVTAICKGKFNIHGVQQIVSIPVTYSVEDDNIFIEGKFSILLSDYNIKIPRIVQAKISPEIEISVNIEMQPEQ